MNSFPLGAAKRDGWACGQASGHAEMWAGQSKIKACEGFLNECLHIHFQFLNYIFPLVSAAICSSNVTSRKRSCDGENCRPTDWRSDCHRWLTDMERKDQVRLTPAVCLPLKYFSHPVTFNPLCFSISHRGAKLSTWKPGQKRTAS